MPATATLEIGKMTTPLPEMPGYGMVNARDDTSQEEYQETEAHFVDMSKGGDNVTLEQYMEYWGYDDTVPNPEDPLKGLWIDKFYRHDMDGNGVVNWTEANIQV